MKVKDLFEKQRIIEGDVDVPTKTTKLNYHGAIIRGHFTCSDTQILSLHGSPQRVEGSFNCTLLRITSLEGSPEYIGVNLNCYNNPRIKSLQNIHKYIKYIGGGLFVPNTIKSHIMGIAMIKGLRSFGFVEETPGQARVENILDKHIFGGDRDIHACQEELIESGLGEYARL